MSPQILTDLVAMTNALGNPALDYVILGEGNTSARADGDTFWVKASGSEMRTVTAGDFVRVRFDRVLDLLEQGDVNDEAIRIGLEGARVDPSARARPSVETVLHALALGAEGVNYVGHTHPTAVNAILCSQRAEELVSGRLFPDEIVYCGLSLVYVPYTDPGVPLARKIRSSLSDYCRETGLPPKVILVQNHGMLALGRSASEVQNVTAMYVKTARILAGACSMGGPHFLSPEHAERIHGRPDEHYRRQAWESR
jgi:rhamnose utilization protein RhaD (predicted bifunctional aldolase and dehydrogenase)